MIVLATDFGLPYIGQMKAALRKRCPATPIIELFTDLPSFDIQAAAYLLPAYLGDFDPPCVFLCVVDPGVGGARAPLIIEADGHWFVGPDNGLFAPLVRRAAAARVWQITWRPSVLSATFHGRDLFAPVAARLAATLPRPNPATLAEATEIAGRPGESWPPDLARVIYIDGFGNAMTGLRAATLDADAVIDITGHTLSRARTFSDLAPGAAFWYENANGLVEIAANQANAARNLGLRIGTELRISVQPTQRAGKKPT